MRDLTISRSDAKRRLLDAAEPLFAERGFDAVSVRDVTQLAKANVAAVNYHFGSRDGLIALVVSRHLTPIHEERIARLDGLEKKFPGKVVPLEELLDAYARPLIGVMRKTELTERLFGKLLGRIFSLQTDELPALMADQTKISIDRFNKALGRTLTGLTQDELAWRFHFAIGGLIQLLLQDEVSLRQPTAVVAGATIEHKLGRWIRFAAAGLRDGLEQPAAQAKRGPQATFDF